MKKFMSQPLGFVKIGKERVVYRLHKALYGLKRAPRAWKNKIDSHLVEFGFTKFRSGYGVYVQSMGDDITLICLC